MKKLSKNFEIGNKNVREKEFKDFIFKSGMVVSVKERTSLIAALAKGEYVIGVCDSPFSPQNIYHYREGVLEIFNIRTSDSPWELNRDTTIYCECPLTAILENLVEGRHNDYITNPSHNFLNLKTIPDISTGKIIPSMRKFLNCCDYCEMAKEVYEVDE